MIEPYDGDKVKVGYRVRSLLHGWGEVRQIDSHGIEIKFENCAWRFYQDGKFYSIDLHPCLVEMEAPKKKVKGWVNVYPGTGSMRDWNVSVTLFSTEAEAKLCAHAYGTVSIPIEFEF